MAVTTKLYGKFFANALGGETAGESVAIDYLSDTIKVALTTSSYTPNQDTHEFFSDVTNELAASGGYTAGGETLGTKALTYSAAANTVTLDAADVTWSAATFTYRYAVIYKDTGTASTSPLIGYIDLGADRSPSAADETLAFSSSGIFVFSVA